jgi:mismatch-specific thymine-DNA glycosylase
MNTLPDYLSEDCRLVIIGINPSLTAALSGRYYSGRGNQFWPLINESGLLPERLASSDASRVTEFGIGLTDLVKRPSKSSGDVLAREFGAGRDVLHRKLKRISCPIVIVFNGKIAYEQFMRKKCDYGLQGHFLYGAKVYVMPSTSRRCARSSYKEKLQHFQRISRLLKVEDNGDN